MAEREALSVGNGQASEAQSAQSGLAPPSADSHGVLRDGPSFTPLGPSGDGVVQPFPRSPKLQRKIAKAAQLSEVNESVVKRTRRDIFSTVQTKSEMTCSKYFK